MQSYKDLLVWQKGMDLAEDCYRLTSSFPREEMYGLTAQIRHASASVPANVAEGHGRESTGSFIQAPRIAQGSLKELETHLLLAERVYSSGPEVVGRCLANCDEVGRMLRSLIRSLQDKARRVAEP